MKGSRDYTRDKRFNPSHPEWIIESSEVAPTFESVDKILQCDRSHESFAAMLSRGTIYLVYSSSVRVCE